MSYEQTVTQDFRFAEIKILIISELVKLIWFNSRKYGEDKIWHLLVGLQIIHLKLPLSSNFSISTDTTKMNIQPLFILPLKKKMKSKKYNTLRLI